MEEVEFRQKPGTVAGDSIDVFLDTEPFRRDPARRSAHFETLTHLAERKAVRLHVSELTVREFTSGTAVELEEAASKTISCIKSLLRFAATADAKDEAQEFLDNATDLFKRLNSDIETSMKRWIKNCDVIVHPILAQHVDGVFEAYFAGTPPFSERKRREDLPDGFICKALTELATQLPRLYFVSGDDGMRRACDCLANVQPFPSVKDFLSVPEIVKILGGGVLDSQLALLRAVFELWVVHSDIARKAVTSELVGRKVFFFYPEKGYYRIVDVISLQRVVPEDLPTNLGDGVLLATFSGRASCNVLLERQDPAGDYEQQGVSLVRTLVFIGSLRFSLPVEILGRAVGSDRVLEALGAAEVSVEDLALHWERGGKNIPNEIFSWHAHDEASRQIQGGNFEAEIDEVEDKDRVEHARWVNVPKELHGTHGKFRITEETRFQIAPMPRFEHWAAFTKRQLLESRDLLSSAGRQEE